MNNQKEFKMNKNENPESSENIYNSRYCPVLLKQIDDVFFISLPLPLNQEQQIMDEPEFDLEMKEFIKNKVGIVIMQFVEDCLYHEYF